MLDKIIIYLNDLLLSLIIFLLITSCERTVSVPPPDEPPPQGYIFIDTYPEGMKIFMDNKDRRRLTPDSITWLESKEYEFTLKHPFFLDTAFNLTATETIRESLFIDYRKNKRMLSTLELDSYPQGASIILNDSLLPTKTPLKLFDQLPGYYNVMYVLENHRTTEHTVLLQSSQVTKSFLPLLDLTLWVDYNSSNTNLNSNNLTCIRKDNNDVVWLGSANRGIYKYEGNSFKNYYSGNSPVLNNNINDIAFTPTRLMLIATEEFAIVVAPERVFGKNENHEWQFWRVGDSVNFLPDNYVTSIAVQENGKFWFGTGNGLISIFPEGGFNIKKIFTSENSNLPDNFISDLEWKNNQLWVGTKSKGFAIFKNMNWESFSTSNTGLRSNVVNKIFPLGSRSGYIGTSTNSNFTPGLALMSNNSWFSEYFDMPDNNVLSVYQDSKGRTWVGTETSIIVFTQWEDRKVYTYENSALPIKDISGFLEDTNGNILITSRGGGMFRYLD